MYCRVLGGAFSYEQGTPALANKNPHHPQGVPMILGTAYRRTLHVALNSFHLQRYAKVAGSPDPLFEQRDWYFIAEQPAPHLAHPKRFPICSGKRGSGGKIEAQKVNSPPTQRSTKGFLAPDGPNVVYLTRRKPPMSRR